MAANDPDQPGGQTRVPTRTRTVYGRRGSRTGNYYGQVPQGAASDRFAAANAAARWYGAPVAGDAFTAFTRANPMPTSSMNPAPTSPWLPPGFPGTGGSRGGGGGGGGGGGLGITQEQIDAVARLFAGGPQQQQFQGFQGPAASPFDSSMYDKLSADTKAAAAADKAASEAAYNQLGSTLQSTYKNPYAQAPATATPQMQNAMAGLMQAQGVSAAPVQDQINAENAYGQNSDQAFMRLLGVLGQNADQNQQSRMAQVAMDRNTAGQGIDATARGYGSGIDMARLGAQRDWRQQQDERAWQTALMNWQGQQATNQANTGINNEWMMSRLNPLMELILGAPGLNYQALFGG